MIYLTQRLDHAHPITASVTLPIDVRVKSRARVSLNDGREAGLMLPRGLLLRGGDLLTTDDGSEVVEGDCDLVDCTCGGGSCGHHGDDSVDDGGEHGGTP